MNTHDKLLKWLQSDEGSLPTLAVVLDRIISVASDPDTTIQELAAVISYDQGMTNNLLRLANSAYYAQREKVESVKRAIAVIGFDEILGITLSMEILSTFKNKSQYRLNLKNQWVHSICVATAAKEIAKKTDPDIAGKIFIPALLHDMGKVILSIHFVEEYIGACKNAAPSKDSALSGRAGCFWHDPCRFCRDADGQMEFSGLHYHAMQISPSSGRRP